MVSPRIRRRIAGAAILAALAMAVPAAPAMAAWRNPYPGDPVLRPAGSPAASPAAAGRTGALGLQAGGTAGFPAGEGTGGGVTPEFTGRGPGVFGWYYQWKLQRAQLRRGTAADPAATPDGTGAGTPAGSSTGGPHGGRGVPTPSTPRPSAPPSQPTEAPRLEPAPSPRDAAASLTAEERRLVELVNLERRNRGLPELAVDPDLTRLARLKARDIQQQGSFSHVSPTYGSPYAMEIAAGIRARVMGAENLAMARDVNAAHRMLMASQGHRANILHPDHDRIGVAVVPVRYGVLVVQLFLGARYR
ncbi:SCP-like extracellular [Thermaerobacter marianensis DSM 12885]|uniref:SCP-like extracellular n=1 Tax=Thermaerobacter marianensis (strain ATCC 700841 / DSM 12885 / JCM 10246 / 7p75a) TaxID=644966 RepID=E6SGI5_THEM7|nr:CAP domain-containing protein [Thermaerobacter marianensis]ADU50531.1 SCP-like extracellular [Thermaerobacter marianensis DSM 12885]